MTHLSRSVYCPWMSPQIFRGASNSRRTGWYRAHFLSLLISRIWGNQSKIKKSLGISKSCVNWVSFLGGNWAHSWLRNISRDFTHNARTSLSDIWTWRPGRLSLTVKWSSLLSVLIYLFRSSILKYLKNYLLRKLIRNSIWSVFSRKKDPFLPKAWW